MFSNLRPPIRPPPVLGHQRHQPALIKVKRRGVLNSVSIHQTSEEDAFASLLAVVEGRSLSVPSILNPAPPFLPSRPLDRVTCEKTGFSLNLFGIKINIQHKWPGILGLEILIPPSLFDWGRGLKPGIYHLPPLIRFPRVIPARPPGPLPLTLFIGPNRLRAPGGPGTSAPRPRLAEPPASAC